MILVSWRIPRSRFPPQHWLKPSAPYVSYFIRPKTHWSLGFSLPSPITPLLVEVRVLLHIPYQWYSFLRPLLPLPLLSPARSGPYCLPSPLYRPAWSGLLRTWPNKIKNVMLNLKSNMKNCFISRPCHFRSKNTIKYFISARCPI